MYDDNQWQIYRLTRKVAVGMRCLNDPYRFRYVVVIRMNQVGINPPGMSKRVFQNLDGDRTGTMTPTQEQLEARCEGGSALIASRRAKRTESRNHITIVTERRESGKRNNGRDTSIAEWCLRSSAGKGQKIKHLSLRTPLIGVNAGILNLSVVYPSQ
ncbi:uncharacterized protein LACBIDRAFT_331312 [Laccaria bicolor S238N-H82]|uniref:Predicted protein n=1 Tax=Laccaria bicolor (strain S238N-H82 / ATCC MYA-4686) TaxID=486041 RepID=B0DP34_LACBS|nr:uncharacterized protein LACBIDRAFT_331312 [Laccaria bicolor S238N-H82]EDR03542.1 predicted protein [Laccaria bicolor S238N-H82]|eukprot:XP_001885690.1 predicted protein [Laccaria bicolor S238N-H82]